MTDIEIAQKFKLKKIGVIAKELGLSSSQFLSYGEYKGKIKIEPKPNKNSKLVLITSINPTKAGEGKTTVAIGLADAMHKQHKKVCLALREPSMGPVFGIKGGATGGGYSQIAPMEEINLNFTGDFHAICEANNLLAALIDNHIFHGNKLGIETVTFSRCVDVNDRALRNVTLNGKNPRSESFCITAASEIMAIMCMAENLADLKQKLGQIMIGFTKLGKPVFVKDLGCQDALAIVLKDALMPNLVQTLASTPAIVHCGPFANIAHGCNSVRATKTALTLADYVVTEAGFGADLGAEKFLDFKCRQAKLNPNCVVIVASIRALKLHGGASEQELDKENLNALKKGFGNLKKHIDTIKNVFKLPFVVALNQFESDSPKEIELLDKLLSHNMICCQVWAKGGDGAMELAQKVCQLCEKKSKPTYCYELDDKIETKIEKIVKKVYGISKVEFSQKAKKAIELCKQNKLDKLPIIVAKTQYSLSSDEKLLGEVKNFTFKVEDVQPRTGGGFLVIICGKIMLMPALSENPNALNMKIDDNGNISGLF